MQATFDKAERWNNEAGGKRLPNNIGDVYDQKSHDSRGHIGQLRLVGR